MIILNHIKNIHKSVDFSDMYVPKPPLMLSTDKMQRVIFEGEINGFFEGILKFKTDSGLDITDKKTSYSHNNVANARKYIKISGA